MPRDSRGASDHDGPHPGGRRQPLPHWPCKGGSRWGRGAATAGWPGGPGRRSLSLQISSTLRAGRPDSYLQSFLSLQQSFLCCTFVIALGGGCFLLTALQLERDQAGAQQPGTGTPSPPTSARLGAEPHRSREHGPPPEPADLLICSFIQKWSLLCARCRGVNTWDALGDRDRQETGRAKDRVRSR